MENTSSCDFRNLIPLVVSIIGWLVIFEQAAHLKNRDDVSKIVTDAKDTIDRIYSSSVAYYTQNEEHIGFLSAEIRSNFLLLSHYLILLQSKGLATKLDKYVVSYRRSVMGDRFETTTFKEMTSNSLNISAITNSKSELKFRVDKLHSDWAEELSLLRRCQSIFRKR